MDNPFLRGMFASRAAADARTMGQIQQMGGLLSLQNALVDQQLHPLKVKQMEMAVANAEMNNRIRSGLLGGGSDVGATGAISGAPQVGGLPGNVGALLLSGDPGLKAYAQAILEQQKPIATREGGGIYSPGTGWVLPPQPKTEAGISYNPTTGQASPVPGYGPAIAGIEGAKAGAVEGAKARFDLVQVPDGRGGTQMMPRAQAAQILGGQDPVPAPAPIPAPSTPPNFPRVSPQEQAQRDADASRIRSAELQPNGGGMIPSGRVLGSSPGEAEKAGSKKREENRAGLEAELPQAKLRLQTQFDDIDRLTSITDEAMKSPALSRSVGLVGAFPSIPGQPAANVDSLIKSLQAQVSGMKLQAMRDASKTGGAVGQVTEREWPRLESMIVALNKNMSPELFREKLSELKVEMGKMKKNIQSAFDEEYGPVNPQRRRTDAANDPLGLR